MEKINVAELLRNCPSGMELDCTMWGNVVLDFIIEGERYPIHIKKKDGGIEVLTENGCFDFDSGARCVIFPKGKDTWEGFVPPVKFKDGDIVATNPGNWIGIMEKEEHDGKVMSVYCVLKGSAGLEIYHEKKGKWCFSRLATEKEKQRLFKAIEDNGYKWNAEKKCLEKLIKPKFKVGDKVRHKEINPDTIYEIREVYDDFYGTDGVAWTIFMKFQDNYELVPNKFDINTLKPFDQVLVRNNIISEDKWKIQFFEKFNNACEYPFICMGSMYKQCIPYKGNEYLLDSKDDCSDFYKNW